MNWTHEEYTDAIKRAAREPNVELRLVIIGALCDAGIATSEKNPGYPKVTGTKGKKSTTNGGRTKFLSVQEQLDKRRKWIGRTVRWGDNNAVYRITKASWNAFEVEYVKGVESDSKLDAYKAADSMTNVERVMTPGLKQANPRHWYLEDGRTVQKGLEDDGLAHPSYVKKGV